MYQFLRINHVEVNTKILSTTDDESKTSFPPHFMTNDNQPTSNTFIETRHKEDAFCQMLLVYLFKWRESLLLQLHSFLAVVTMRPATKTLLTCSFHTVFCPWTALVECKILHTNMTMHPMPTPSQTHIEIGSTNGVWNRYLVIKTTRHSSVNNQPFLASTTRFACINGLRQP